MRATLSVLTALLLIWPQAALAESSAQRQAVAALVQKDGAGVYKLAWQRRLLQIQREFAAELAGAEVDYTATGSITPIDPVLQPR